MTESIDTKQSSKRQRDLARASKSSTAEAELPTAPSVGMPASASSLRTQSKVVQVMELLQRPEGATITQLIEITCWLPHSTRAALTGLRKQGHVVTSEKVEGAERIYRMVAA